MPECGLLGVFICPAGTCDTPTRSGAPAAEAGRLDDETVTDVRTLACVWRRSSIGSRPQTAPVAQLDRAPDYESGGRGFESCPVRHSLLPRSPSDVRWPNNLATGAISRVTPVTDSPTRQELRSRHRGCRSLSRPCSCPWSSLCSGRCTTRWSCPETCNRRGCEDHRLRPKPWPIPAILPA